MLKYNRRDLHRPPGHHRESPDLPAHRNPEDAGIRRANKDTTAVKIKAQRAKSVNLKFKIAFSCF
jgi:hypothetical protein